MTPVARRASWHKVQSFVAVQTGCDHRCTFCSIWQARGPSRSLPFEAIRDAVAREIDRGAKEIVLTGVDITDYDGGLGTLCQRLLAAEPRLQRLRLSSLDSIEIDDALFELIAGEPRLMPHFHLSLQAGDDMILKRMKRRHSRADAVRTVERIKAARPDATIGADLIAGFPTETEDMALNSLKLLDDCDIIAAHIFPFSPRPNTPAARMPQLAREVVKARAARLREAAAERRSALARQPGRHHPAGADRKRRQGPQRRFRAGLRSHGAGAATAASARITGARRRSPDRRSGHELARPPARRLCQDRRAGRRQSHRPHQPRRARHRDPRRHRGGADRLRPRPRSLAPHPRGDRRPQVRAARRARASHDPRRGDREDPRAGRQAAGNLGLSRART